MDHASPYPSVIQIYSFVSAKKLLLTAKAFPFLLYYAEPEQNCISKAPQALQQHTLLHGLAFLKRGKFRQCEEKF